MEYYIKDLSALMTDIGGNIGLFLGYSILTIIMGLLEVLQLSWKRSNLKGKLKQQRKTKHEKQTSTID